MTRKRRGLPPRLAKYDLLVDHLVDEFLRDRGLVVAPTDAPEWVRRHPAVVGRPHPDTIEKRSRSGKFIGWSRKGRRGRPAMLTPDPEHEAAVRAAKRAVGYVSQARRAAGLASGRMRQSKKTDTEARIQAAQAATPKRYGSQKAIARSAGVSTSLLRKRKKKRD
jgi:hypothetical protein